MLMMPSAVHLKIQAMLIADASEERREPSWIVDTNIRQAND
jgi:hypothetical protein